MFHCCKKIFIIQYILCCKLAHSEHFPIFYKFQTNPLLVYDKITHATVADSVCLSSTHLLDSFDQSDKIIILDIYASKRETVDHIHSKDLVRKINSPDVIYKSDISATAKFLKTKIKKPSDILTLGISEVWRLAKLL